MTNTLHRTSGGWVAIRHINYDGTATVYGIPYHQITPIISAGEWNDMLAWCVSTFGPSGTENKPGVWSVDERWYANSAKFLFKDKQDCEWFLLRWA
jgi:hypothetical protein